jgi:threonine dehydratase
VSKLKYREAFALLSRVYDRISPHIHRTPLEYSRTFSEISGGSIYLKLENLQKTGSFKVRGAFSKLTSLGKEAENGVIAVSAGNHAQGVAYAAKVLGIKATVVMPETAPIAKIQATQAYGAEVILHGKYIHESMKVAEDIISKSRKVLIHPYNDQDVILGQGTIGLELLEADPDVVVVPVGGGGLISGIAISLKARKPSVRLIGVQSDSSPSMKISKEAGRIVEVDPSYSIADGILVKTPSDLTYSIVNELVDDIVLVDDEELEDSISLLLERAKTVAEGAGAASLAAVLSSKVKVKGKKVICLISGGNIDLTLLSNIINKTMHKFKRVIKIRVSVPDKPGYLNRVLSYIAQIRGNIIDVVHERFEANVRPGYTNIYVTFELLNSETLNAIINRLASENIEVKVVE